MMPWQCSHAPPYCHQDQASWTDNLLKFYACGCIFRLMTTPDTAPPPPAQAMVFTDAAARKVMELIMEEANPELKLRVYISGGGCSGFQYGFSFDEAAEEDDIRVVNDGVTLLIDPMSFQYLMGAEVDYTENLQGAQFVIRNPNASTTCGCGASFSV